MTVVEEGGQTGRQTDRQQTDRQGGGGLEG